MLLSSFIVARRGVKYANERHAGVWDVTQESKRLSSEILKIGVPPSVSELLQNQFS